MASDRRRAGSLMVSPTPSTWRPCRQELSLFSLAVSILPGSVLLLREPVNELEGAGTTTVTHPSLGHLAALSLYSASSPFLPIWGPQTTFGFSLSSDPPPRSYPPLTSPGKTHRQLGRWTGKETETTRWVVQAYNPSHAERLGQEG